MKKCLLSVSLLLMCFTAALRADFKSDIINGVKAYKDGKYTAAYAFFKAAYAVQPSQKLGLFMEAALKKAKDSPENQLQAAYAEIGYEGWSEKENIISFSPAFLAAGILAMHYERKLTRHASAGFDAGYSLTGNSIGVAGTPDSWSGYYGYGYVVGAAINWYPESRSPNGWFLGPQTHYYDLIITYSGDMAALIKSTAQTYYTAGIQGGYRWILETGLSLDFSAGAIYMAGSMCNKSDIAQFNSKVDFHYTYPTFSVNVGLGF